MENKSQSSSLILVISYRHEAVQMYSHVSWASMLLASSESTKKKTGYRQKDYKTPALISTKLTEEYALGMQPKSVSNTKQPTLNT